MSGPGRAIHSLRLVSATMTPVILVGAAIAIGAVAGSLFPARFSPDVASAAIPVILRVHPGATSTVACWWHGTCYAYPDRPTRGTGMDWQNPGGNPPVYWRSFGARGDGQSLKIGTGRILNTTGRCNEVSVRVTDIFAFEKGWIRYTHSGTWTPDWEFTINGAAPIYGAWTQVGIGFSKWPEQTGCPATGQHLHEDATAQWTRNTAVYPSVVCYQGDPCTPPLPPANDGEGTNYPNFLNGGQEQYWQRWDW